MSDTKQDEREPLVKGGMRVLGMVNGNGQFMDMSEAEREGFKMLSTYITGKKQAELQFDREHKEKSVGVYGNPDYQTSQELTETDEKMVYGMDIIDTPYNYTLLNELLHKNVTHGACVETKACDYSCHGWELMVREDAKEVDKKEIDRAKNEAMNFLEKCVDGMLPIDHLIKDVALDYENIGNGAFEIIRNKKFMVSRLNHIPAHTLRVHRNAVLNKTGQHYVQCRFNKRRMFMPFGGTVNVIGFDPLSSPVSEFPKIDERSNFITRAKHLYSRDKDGEFVTNVKFAATELFWLNRSPKTKSTVYGTPAGCAAYGNMLGEMRADYFNLSYFNSKGVPQFAVILENPNPIYSAGAAPRQDGDLDPTAAAAAAVEEFFAKKLNAADRNVLVLEGIGGSKIRFERLSPETIDESMLAYVKSCRESTRLAHRVPPAALGIIESANLGSGRESSQMLRYRSHIVTPGQRVFASCVNVLLRVGLLIPYFDFSFYLMPVDDEQERREFKLKEFINGAITPNEYRRETKRREFVDSEGNKSDAGDSLYLRQAQIAIISPDNGLITTAPGDIPGNTGGVQDIGSQNNPAAPGDLAN